MLVGSFENDLCDGVFCGVRDGEVRRGCSGLLEQFTHEAVKEKDGCARCERGDFDVLPCDAAAPSGLQRLERRFFCREACGIMLCGDGPATIAVSALGVCVDALSETRRALDDFSNATDFNDVYSNGNNHRRNGNSA